MCAFRPQISSPLERGQGCVTYSFRTLTSLSIKTITSFRKKTKINISGTHKHTPDPSLRGELFNVTLKKFIVPVRCSPLEKGQGCVLSIPSLKHFAAKARSVRCHKENRRDTYNEEALRNKICLRFCPGQNRVILF